MKYIKESINNYNIKVFTADDASDLYQRFLKKYKYKYDLKSKIHYYSGFDTIYGSEDYRKTCRYIIAYNDKDILGICHFAHYDSSDHYAISYLSTNKDFFSMGISKKLLEELFKYFSETYPNETLNFSGYSVDGWKYLRKYILEYSKKYNVKIKEKGVEYPGIAGKFTDEDYKLIRTSREEAEKIYGPYY